MARRTRLNQSSLLTLLLVFLLGISLGWFVVKTHVLSSGDLVINLSPTHKSIEVYRNEAEEVMFSISPENRYLCDSKCYYWLTDSSTRDVLDYDSTIIKHKESFRKYYEFTAPKFGSGQKIYNFDVKCTNIRSFLCPIRTPEKHKTAILTMNYKLTDYEEHLKLQARENLTDALLMLSSMDMSSQRLDNEINDLKLDLKLGDLDKKNEDIHASLGMLNEKIIALRDLWDAEDYRRLGSLLNGDLINELSTVEKKLNESEMQLLNALRMHNKISRWITENNKRVKNLLKLVENDDTKIDSEITDKINYLLAESKNVSERFIKKNFTDYDEIEGQISAVDSIYEEFELNKGERFSDIIGSGNFIIEKEYRAACNLKGYCIDYNKSHLSDSIDKNLDGIDNLCRNISSLSPVFSKANDNFLIGYYQKNYAASQNLSVQEITTFVYNETGVKNYFNDDEFSDLLNNTLKNSQIEMENRLIGGQNEKIEGYNKLINKTNSYIKNANYYISRYDFGNLSTDKCNKLIGISNDKGGFFKKEFLLERLLSVCNPLIEKIKNKSKEAKSLRTNLLSTLLIGMIDAIKPIENISLEPISIVNESIKNISSAELNIVIKINYSEESAEFYNNYCYNLNSSILKKEIKLFNYTLGNITAPQLNLSSYNLVSRINATLKENFPVCCFLGACSVCCYNNTCDYPSLFPVIFLHGHAFNKEDSPDYSLDGFNKLQKKFQEGGYIDGGIVLPSSKYSDIKEGEWGAQGKPVVVKTSYYYDVYNEEGQTEDIPQKSENISVYSQRLKEAIDIVKYRTGKSKVNIIAHSMGGLVARRYLQLYGEDSVYKIVMIGTPNEGIRGSVSDFCPIVGERKECGDMSAGSTFIKKLNEFVPKETKMHTITGIGCSMDEGDGDGVVLSQDSLLPYSQSYKIEGNCSFPNLLHVEMLDTDKYPRVFALIKDILKD